MPTIMPPNNATPDDIAAEAMGLVAIASMRILRSKGIYEQCDLLEVISSYTTKMYVEALKRVSDAQTMSSYPMTKGAPAPKLF